MKWFGESWHAPINESAQHCDTPVGWACIGCHNPISPEDRGVVIPSIGAKEFTMVAEHLNCFLKSVLGPNYQELLGESYG